MIFHQQSIAIFWRKNLKKVPARSARFLKAFPFCAQTKIFLTVRFLLVFSIAVFPFLQQYTMHAKVKKKHTISLKRQRFCVKTRFEERKCIEKWIKNPSRKYRVSNCPWKNSVSKIRFRFDQFLEINQDVKYFRKDLIKVLWTSISLNLWA